MYKSYRNPSDIDSQVSLPRSYTLPREFKYKKPKSRKAIRTEHFIHSTNSSDGKAAPPFVDNQEMNITYISLFSRLFRWRRFSRRQRRGRHTGFGYAAFPTAPPTRASVRLRQPQSNAIAFQRLGFAQSTRNEALKYKQPTGRLFHFCNTRRNYPNREKPIKLCREMLTFRLRVVQDLFLLLIVAHFSSPTCPLPHNSWNIFTRCCFVFFRLLTMPTKSIFGEFGIFFFLCLARAISNRLICYVLYDRDRVVVVQYLFSMFAMFVFLPFCAMFRYVEGLF